MPVRSVQTSKLLAVAALAAVALVHGQATGDGTLPVPYADVGDSGSDPRTAQIWQPEGDGPHPAVVVIHGGGWRSGSPQVMDGIAEQLARRGYVAVNVGYRLAPEHRYPAQLEDCRDAVRWVRANAQRLRVDPERIAAFGYSAGAHLALLLGTYPDGDDSRVAAVVAGAAPTDLRVFPDSPMVLALLEQRRSDAPELWRSASPVVHASADDAPTFLYHGTWDTLVSFEHSEWMRDALAGASVPVELRPVRGLGHYLTFVVDPGVVDDAIDFLDEHLRR